MRKGVETLLDIAENLWREGEARPILFFAPGGYGKSVAPPYLLKTAKDIGLAHQLIHVLPTRSLVLNLYLCKYLYPFTSGMEKTKLEEICMGRVAYEELANIVKSVAQGRERVAYQAGMDIRYEVEGKRLQVRKSPLFEDADIVVTTLDSLMFNAFKVPVTEIYRRKKHYAIPFSHIYTSLVYLDEMHASFDDKAFNSTIVLLDLLNAAKIPVIAATATPVSNTAELIHSYTNGRVKPIVVKMCKRGDTRWDGIRCFYDDEFEGKVLNVKWRTRFINSNDILNTVYESIRNGKRMLIAVNDVEEALPIFDELKKNPDIASQTTLLHGKMSRERQRSVLEQLNNKKVLVTTPIINAGVDISFDAAVIKVSDPLIVTQFLARVCRDNNCEEAEVYLVKDAMKGSIYRELERVISNNIELNWHLPYSLNDVSGYDVMLKLASIPSVEPKRIIKLRDLAFSALLTAEEIRDLFIKELSGEIARSILTEIATITEDEVKKILNELQASCENKRCVDEVVKRLEDLSITISFPDLMKSLKKGEIECLGKFLIVDANGDLKFFSIEHGDIKIDGRLIDNSYNYLKTLIELGARYAGFILSKKDGCYDDERGLLRIP